ncbi:MAG TPA: ribose 5-phosphate isomerase A [Nitrososphaerales archaeon]|nr:ribose 5-phosphate isomerase A [Nitrososphaerales archaeon]
MSSDSLETAFDRMAEAVAGSLSNNDLLGLGSGSAVARFTKALGRRAKIEPIKIYVVPSSMQSFLLARENGLELARDTARCPESIDIVVDGADQISVSTRSMIKGGGGALLKEKILISASKRTVILGDQSKYVKWLNRSVPVEVTQFAYLRVAGEIHRKFGADPALRKLEKGYPYYSESGNVILDCQFREEITSPRDIERELKMIPGVVECGIFTAEVEKFYRANPDGSFDVL